MIKGLLAKSLVRKLAPFGVGMAVTGSIGGVLVFPNHYVDASPCCTDANAATPTASPEASEDIKNPESNIQDVLEAGYLEQSPAKIPTLSFREGLLTLIRGRQLF
ncbi:hypothetical protein [Allocoleopsis franciscana]|uniref:hypothetical protein n=1 Tax=Allocoleopsis franciscana TaxID=2886352 RepID=UPI0012DD6AF5|nr:hypothetical protein [Allocoleopsis franciscana]